MPVLLLLCCLVLIIFVAHTSAPEVGAWRQSLLVLLAVGGIVAALTACYRAVRGVAMPIAELVEVAAAVRNGRAKHRASGKMAGEFRVLAEALNQMIESRQQAEEKLRLGQESLEFKVRARTVELWRANKALREEMDQRAKAERELQQSQKMDALGKFAGAIAHDFNNLLTVILGGTDCAMQQLSTTHPAVHFMETVRKAGESAAQLTRPLLTFSRNEVLAVEPMDINASVEEAAVLIARLIGLNIHVSLGLQKGLPTIIANPNQVQQVLVNLAVNARDAMNGSGALKIATRLVPARELNVPQETAATEHWVELKVTDSGCGMDAVTKARIFEPFFTTKPAGRGTGLGLATVFGIIKQAQGFLEVDSAVGEGTSFRVYLPASDKPLEIEAEPEKYTATAESRAGGTLLFVDDEDDIRELATLMLEEKGYTVLAASNAEEAILVAEQHLGAIDALITDVVMPGINGVQLAGLVKGMVPGIRVLFVSGHCCESVPAETLLDNRGDYLQKPYRSDALLSKIDGLLKAADKPPVSTSAKIPAPPPPPMRKPESAALSSV